MGVAQFLQPFGEAIDEFLTRTGLLVRLNLDKPSSPKAPDYKGAAIEQGKANVNAAIANAIIGNVAQETPFGRQSFRESGGRNVGGIFVPSYTATTTLSPEMQGLLGRDIQQRLGLAGLSDAAIARTGESLELPLDFGTPEARQRAEDAIYSTHARYLDPQWAQNEESERARLANMGFKQGDIGYNRALEDFYGRKGQAYGAAREAAITGGRDERRQAVAEALAAREQPLKELNILRTGAAPTMPQFGQVGTTPGIQPANIFGATQAQYGAAADQYNADVAAYNNQMQGLYGLAATALTAYF